MTFKSNVYWRWKEDCSFQIDKKKTWREKERERERGGGKEGKRKEWRGGGVLAVKLLFRRTKDLGRRSDAATGQSTSLAHQL